MHLRDIPQPGSNFKFIFYGENKSMYESLSVIINMENREELPRNFRMTEEPYHVEEMIQNLEIPSNPSPSTLGLPELRASASGQFSERSLARILEIVPADKIFLIDLREEYHGFINGIAVSWFAEKNWSNMDKSLEEILLGEKQLLQKAKNDQYIGLYEKYSE